jgi:poly-beta-hydroxyalkanoate depolymerase
VPLFDANGIKHENGLEDSSDALMTILRDIHPGAILYGTSQATVRDVIVGSIMHQNPDEYQGCEPEAIILVCGPLNPYISPGVTTQIAQFPVQVITVGAKYPGVNRGVVPGNAMAVVWKANGNFSDFVPYALPAKHATDMQAHFRDNCLVKRSHRHRGELVDPRAIGKNCLVVTAEGGSDTITGPGQTHYGRVMMSNARHGEPITLEGMDHSGMHGTAATSNIIRSVVSQLGSKRYIRGCALV